MTPSVLDSFILGDLFSDEFYWYREQARLFLGNPERPTLGRLFKILLSRLGRLEPKRLSAIDPAQIKDLAKLLSFLPAPSGMNSLGVAVSGGMRVAREAMSCRDESREKTFNHLKTIPPFHEILTITNPKIKKARHAPTAVRHLAVVAYDIHLQYPRLTWKQIAAILKKDKTTIRNAVRHLKKFLDTL